MPIRAYTQIVNYHIEDSSYYKNKRPLYLITSQAVVATSSIIALNNLWYKNYSRSKFHFFNDGNEWLQMDKAGHILTSYQINKISYQNMLEMGKSDKFSLIYGTTFTVAYMTSIEVLDGFSSEWGFSLWDFSANALGTLIFDIQQVALKEQKFILKYSYYKSEYVQYKPSLLGNSLIENIIKDYNGQTYWISANIASLYKNSSLPKWLNFAFGYGANGMISAKNVSLTLPYFKRYRQFYFSPDIDLSRIRVKNKTLKLCLNLVNFIKIPAPTIEVKENGKITLYPLYF